MSYLYGLFVAVAMTLAMLTPLPKEIEPATETMDGRLYVCKHDALFRLEDGSQRECFKLIVPENVRYGEDLGADGSEAAYHRNDLRRVRVTGIVGRKITDICWELTVTKFEWIEEKPKKLEIQG